LPEVVVEELEVDIVKIIKAKSKDKEVVRVVKERKAYVLKDKKLRVEIIWMY